MGYLLRDQPNANMNWQAKEARLTGYINKSYYRMYSNQILDSICNDININEIIFIEKYKESLWVNPSIHVL